MRRRLTLFAVTLVLLCSYALANAQELTLAVNEGVTYPDEGSITERYKPLTDILSKVLKRPVRAKQVHRYVALDELLAGQQADFAFVHPAHIGLRAVDSGKYVGLATAKGYTNYHATVLVKADSPVKAIGDLRGRKVGVPAVESITTVMFSARLKDLSIKLPPYAITTFQDAIPFMVANNLVDAGVTGSASIAREWETNGGRVIDESAPVPIKQFLASTKLSKADIDRVRALLLDMENTAAGRAILSNIKIAGFIGWDDGKMHSLAAKLHVWECEPPPTVPPAQLVGSF